ncbi:MAG: hypothetical protein FJ128_02675 [Deltaproteobacteria bacterium]|nr:hypothetical protein [Deltaproteobacteria bacterium]
MDILLDLAIGLIGALLGAVLGGRAVGRAYLRLGRQAAAEGEARKLLNLFAALHAELNQVWQAYQAVLGERLEKAEDHDSLAFAGVFQASQHYFSVYDFSAHTLGLLDPDSCRRVVEAYVNLKGFFDELNQFHLLADRLRGLRLQADLNLYEAKQMREEMEGFFAYLKKRHLQVKGLALGALELLQEFLTLGKQARNSVKIKV